MICNKCGCRLDEGSIFCPVCGVKLAAAAPVSAPVQQAAAAPVQSAVQQAAAAAPEPKTLSAESFSRPAEVDTASEPAPNREKEFFGKGAFIFCLALIMLLAATTGLFGYLYFAAIGAI